MNLYQINREMEQALNNVTIDEETGEVTMNLEEVEALALAKEDKVESICLYIKNLTAEAKALRDEETALAKRRKTTEAKVERLKAYIADNLKGETFESPRFKLTWRKSQETIITDDSLISADYVLTKVTTSFDKTAIKKAILAGETVEGAEVVEKYNPQIK